MIPMAAVTLFYGLVAPRLRELEEGEDDLGTWGLRILALLGAASLGVFLWIMYRLFRGRCAQCEGTGRLLETSPPVPFLWKEDREKLQPGKCRKCGYDLTGNQSGLCPECGTPTL
jgi:hypothetical protein